MFSVSRFSKLVRFKPRMALNILSLIKSQIGIFNVNKSSNAPDLIRNFNGKDVYSLAFGIDSANPSKYLIYATSGNRLMIFNENSIKSDKHQFISFHTCVSYVRTMETFVAIGLNNGEFSIFKNDNLKKVGHIKPSSAI